MEDIQIVREFKDNVKQVYPSAEIYFYGSRVKKTHRVDSDLDVLVLLKQVNPTARKVIYDTSWEIGFKYDILIAPVLSRSDDFHSFDVSPFFNSVKNHGVSI